MFPFVPDVPTETRALVERAARALLRDLSDLPDTPTLRVADADGRLACLILVWDAGEAMPTAGAERRKRTGGPRAECKQDIVAVVTAAGRPLTRKQVVRALRSAGKQHGAGTVAKALAELARAGELVNTKDKKGYRLPNWPRRKESPSLF